MKNLVKVVSVILGLTIASTSFAQQLEVVVCLSEANPLQVLVEKAVNVNSATQAVFLEYDPQTGDPTFLAPLSVSHLNAAGDSITLAGEFSDDAGTYKVKVSTTSAGVESGVNQDGTPYSVEVYKGLLDVSLSDGTTLSDPVVCFIEPAVQ